MLKCECPRRRENFTVFDDMKTSACEPRGKSDTILPSETNTQSPERHDIPIFAEASYTRLRFESVWGILRLKAWACAGAAAAVAYSVPDVSFQAWAYCAASTAVGACTLRLGPALSAAAGVAAMASSLFFYSVFFS